jgi:phosphoenolpyruvate carboxykinase (GTP)
VLVTKNLPYWIGDGRLIPEKGVNFSGDWYIGKKDNEGKEIPHAHPNARYTIRIEELNNADENLHNPDGVPISGIFYGGRDSDTMPPVLESLNWEHGVFLGATIESETTSATIGAEGVRKQQPFANLDFIVINLGKYLKNHQDFGSRLKICPKVFATNYFLKNKDGKYLNGVLDKLCWVIWAEGRAQNDYKAIETPMGFIPLYSDLKSLFNIYLEKDYTEKEYAEQFSIRTKKLLEKIDRIESFYKKEKDIPLFFWKILNSQKESLIHIKYGYGKDVISPLIFKKQ